MHDNNVWEKYLCILGKKNPLAPSRFCAKHHNMIWRITENHVCSACMESNTRAWSLAGTLTSTHELSDCDWVCDQCIDNGSVISDDCDKLSTVGAVYLPQLYDEYTQTHGVQKIQAASVQKACYSVG